MRVTPRLEQVVRRPEEARTPGPRFEGVQRLVVVRHDRFGDLVLTLPAVAALRRTYPGARFALLVRPDLVPLARAVEGVEDVLRASADRRRLRREIAAYRPDLIVCISRGAGISRIAARARVKRRVGTGYRLYSPLFTRTVNERRRSGGRHELEYALSFAHRVGAQPGPAVFPLRIPDAARGVVSAWVAAGGLQPPFVLLHPGSGGSCPRWPVRRFIELADQLLAVHASVAFSIGPEDAACEEVLDAARARVRDLPRFRGDLTALPALLESAACVVSNSTGPLHLAAALGTPTLGVYAPWATCGVVRWGPYAENGWAITAVSQEATSWTRAERRQLGAQLLAAIPAAAVAACVMALLAGRAPVVPPSG
jgi:ADP-heptose:LPS heptosyltransferase